MARWRREDPTGAADIKQDRAQLRACLRPPKLPDSRRLRSVSAEAPCHFRRVQELSEWGPRIAGHAGEVRLTPQRCCSTPLPDCEGDTHAWTGLSRMRLREHAQQCPRGWRRFLSPFFWAWLRHLQLPLLQIEFPHPSQLRSPHPPRPSPHGPLRSSCRRVRRSPGNWSSSCESCASRWRIGVFGRPRRR